LDCPPQGVKLGAYWFGFYFLDEPVEAPSTSSTQAIQALIKASTIWLVETIA
jgi:hypothetical protein